MPRGRKGERRPAYVIGNAVKIMRIATGEEPEDYGPEDTKDQAAKALGRKGVFPMGKGLDVCAVNVAGALRLHSAIMVPPKRILRVAGARPLPFAAIVGRDGGSASIGQPQYADAIIPGFPIRSS